MSELFKKAFGEELIVFRAGGSSFPLYVGVRPTKKTGEDDLSKSYVESLLKSSVPLHEQGDGMRSFASVLLHTLAAGQHSVQFLDEPEAFLHPPQARLLGQFIASERNKGQSQLFIATHSKDMLEGLISGSDSKVRVVRLQRKGSINYVKQLDREKAKRIASDTLTRYSGVFDGIFYKHVIIAESDSDCMFYSSMLSSAAVSGSIQLDVLFIHGSGKHRMARLVATLRALDVPVSVIADIDLLNEASTLRDLVEALSGFWGEVEPHWVAIKKGVEEVRPPFTAEQVKTQVAQALDGVGGSGEFPKSVQKQISGIFRSMSPWEVVKHSGRAGLRGAQTINHFDKLVSQCAQIGLWIVPVGELEGFCRTVEAGKGPAFVQKVLDERDLNVDPDLREAREFIGRVWHNITGGNPAEDMKA